MLLSFRSLEAIAWKRCYCEPYHLTCLDLWLLFCSKQRFWFHTHSVRCSDSRILSMGHGTRQECESCLRRSRVQPLVAHPKEGMTVEGASSPHCILYCLPEFWREASVQRSTYLGYSVVKGRLPLGEQSAVRSIPTRRPTGNLSARRVIINHVS